MKKMFFLVAAIFAALTINAADLWTGNQPVTWGSPLVIEKTLFADAQAGQKIVLHFTAASDGVEFKLQKEGFPHLPGSRESAWINGDGTIEVFLTAKAVEGLKEFNLEIIGNNFNATKVELLDGREPKEGITVWSGWFWADDYTTLELYADGYNYVDFNTIDAVRFYSEASGPAYILNVRSTWDEDGFIADKNQMIDGEGYAELPLTDDLRSKLQNAVRWMVQFNKEALAAFNVTDIVLVPKANTEEDPEENPDEDPETAVQNNVIEKKPVKQIVDGQVVIIRDGKKFNLLGAEL